MLKLLSKIITSVSLVLIFGIAVTAQVSRNSPYSRIGLGDILTSDFVGLRSMGGISAAYSDAYLTNLSNPASLAYLEATAFEVGFDFGVSTLKSTSSSDNFLGGNINYLSLAFPVINPINRVLDRRQDDFNWGVCFALQPFSRVSYHSEVEQEITDIGTTSYQAEGQGGTNKVLLANGFKYKDFAAGLTIGYMFGEIEEQQATLFGDLVLPYHNYEDKKINYRGFFYDFGIQKTFVFSEDDREKGTSLESLTVGINAHSATNFSTRSSNLLARIAQSPTYFGIGSNLLQEEVDTLAMETDVKNRGKMPAKIGLGLMYKKGRGFQAGINFDQESWSKFENEADKNVKYANRWLFSLGAEYSPNPSSITKYFETVKYRGGIYFGNDPRLIDGEQLNSVGISAGLGLPIFVARQLSYINIGLEVGSLKNKNVSISENFVRFNVGVTLNNNLWFYKRKYN